MKATRRVSWNWLGKKLRTQLMAGIILIVPVSVTIWVLYWIFTAIDGILQPVIMRIWDYTIPGVGFGATIAVVYLVGVIASNVLGRKLIHYGESLVAKVPLVRQMYGGLKQILESFSAPNKTGFMQVVLAEFPRKGTRTIGFVTNESSGESGKKLLNIFIPTSPNPTSGFLQIMSESEVIRTNISVDDALKMVVTAGRVSLNEIEDRLYERIK